jgi:acrylyl-CoA reductase (NADPH)
MPFRAIYLEKTADGRTIADVRDLDQSVLPPEVDDAVTIDVSYSTINYKDALAITGTSPVVRRFPMVPGIDLAGTVLDSRSPSWRAGDEVILTGWGAGETHWGGLSQRARVSGEWLVRRPDTLTPYDAMAVGTAGFTAALCLMAIDAHGVQPGDGDVLVTGASGGVGSLGILLLARRGHRVVASTGKVHEAEYLRRLGASEIIDRRELSQPGRPLLKERWAAALDTVGSQTLANVCASTKSNGIVTACGLAQGMDFPATVAPFILRGVTLAGINSVLLAHAKRMAAWSLIERMVDRGRLRELSTEIGLADAIAEAPRILAGEVKGRLVVDVTR